MSAPTPTLEDLEAVDNLLERAEEALDDLAALCAPWEGPGVVASALRIGTAETLAWARSTKRTVADWRLWFAEQEAGALT